MPTWAELSGLAQVGTRELARGALGVRRKLYPETTARGEVPAEPLQPRTWLLRTESDRTVTRFDGRPPILPGRASQGSGDHRPSRQRAFVQETPKSFFPRCYIGQ